MRLFISALAFLTTTIFLSAALHAEPVENQIKVLVWDEQQPVEPKIYPNFPGNHIARFLAKNSRLDVTSASIRDPQQGLSTTALKNADVLVYWGHVRHQEISPEKSQEIVDRVKQGQLAMITLHSAHWSVPFMVAMQEKVAQDALERLPVKARSKATIHFEGEITWQKPAIDDRNDFRTAYSLNDEGNVEIRVQRPHCVFLRCCTPMQPSLMRVINPDHPIAQDVPATFEIPETEMYDERFGVPEPDELILTETWQGGEYFRSGMVWNVGQGKVFYFRPGDQQYPVFYEQPVLKIIENACDWMGTLVRSNKT